MSWRTAIALDEYRNEVNRRFPNRSKASDGTIGDNAHAGQGKGSDHNPWVVKNGVGVVRAFDLTHDPRNGVDCDKLSDYLFEMGKAGDPRLRNQGYIIFNWWITNPDWRSWRRYTGSNGHTSHMHISFSVDGYDNRGDWSKAFAGIVVPTPTPITPTPPTAGPNPLPTLQRGSIGPDVAYLQNQLNRMFSSYSTLAVDGDFGPATEAVVRQVQSRSGLAVDGIVGPATWRAAGVR
ncbi:hypothetical protein ABH922_002803 [Rhodococcus sp. 27YEA15]|uniref:peptidoglycan-binding domain-containing protein n=1 Tax=Rhodococcus sp. 27YEA15 TaxID=3156259 RepID=UPI003C7E3450